MRKTQWLTLVLLLFALPGLFANAETIAKMPKPTGYIDDYAHVFSAPAKEQMESLCRELHDKTKAQVFVVTVNSLDGTPIEEFTNDLFHTWKIGEKKTDRGALLLFAIKEHKYRYEIGYGLEGILNDAKVGDMGRAMLPDLRSGDYDTAATLGLHSIVQVIADDSKVQLDGLALPSASTPAPVEIENPSPVEGPPPSSESPTGKIILGLLPFFFFSSIFGLIAWSVIRAVRNGTASFGGGSSSSFGDSSSSSSESSSSSDDSFSGGDGGDSGGGGASGSW